MPLLRRNGDSVTPQTLFISGLPPIQVQRPRAWTYDESEPKGYSYAHSLALVCPKCLAQWAVLSFAEPDHHVQGMWCSRCTPADPTFHPGMIPGSILGTYNIDYPLLEALPEALLRREFELHLKEYERRLR